MPSMTDDTPLPADFHWPVRVYWEDTDAGGVVFYANYLKFFERARTEWLRSLGIEQQALKNRTGAVFVVEETSVKYRRPARLDDALTITVNLVSLGRSSLTLAQQAWRGSDLMVEGRIRIACVDVTRFRPRRLPDELAASLAARPLYPIAPTATAAPISP
jgi:acyl-CoA thioester hydrolase